MKSTLLTCLAAAMLAGAAMSAPPVKKVSAMNTTDKTFMMTLAKAGAAEIQAGQIAAQRGNRFDKRYGRQMVKEHQMAAAQLQKMANNRNVILPSAPAPEDSVAIHRLESASKAQFDTMYHHFAMMSHRGAVKLFRDEIANGRDPAIKAWAKKTLPTIRKHYSEAKSMEME